GRKRGEVGRTTGRYRQVTGDRSSFDVDLQLAGGAASVHRDGVPVVAGLAPQAVDATVAAAWDGLAAGTAPGLVVGGQVLAVVSLLDAGPVHPVAAEGRPPSAPRLAAAGAAVVDAVVADLGAVDDPIATSGRADGRLARERRERQLVRRAAHVAL